MMKTVRTGKWETFTARTIPILAIVIIFFLGVSHLPGESGGDTLLNPVADVAAGAGGIDWIPRVNYQELVLTVSFPGGQVMRRTFKSGQAPHLDFSPVDGFVFVDGQYNYQLKVIPYGEKKIRSGGNAAESVSGSKPMVQSGSFRLEGGTISPGFDTQLPDSAKDIVHNDDVIVDGNFCAGITCADGYDFGTNVIAMHDNNVRLFFDDSSVAPFPLNDWKIVINSSTSGGASYFRIEDSTGGRSVFQIEAGAPSNALYVDDDGRLGLGTSTPAHEIHTISGNTPTIRFEQDNSEAWTPQVWDVAGNESNFFIRDTTGGNDLPFQIQTGSPDEAFAIKSTGRIGQGTDLPSYHFHQVTNSSTNAQFVAERTSGAKTILSGTGSAGFIGTLNDYPVRITVNNQQRMELNNDDSVDMNNGASLTAGGVWTDASSREYKNNINELNSSDAFETLEKLTPVTYFYKKEADERYVGFIAEEVPELVAMKNRKGLAAMEIVAVLTKVLKEQQTVNKKYMDTITELQRKIKKLEKEVRSIKK